MAGILKSRITVIALMGTLGLFGSGCRARLMGSDVFMFVSSSARGSTISTDDGFTSTQPNWDLERKGAMLIIRGLYAPSPEGDAVLQAKLPGAPRTPFGLGKPDEEKEPGSPVSVTGSLQVKPPAIHADECVEIGEPNPDVWTPNRCSVPGSSPPVSSGR